MTKILLFQFKIWGSFQCSPINLVVKNSYWFVLFFVKLPLKNCSKQTALEIEQLNARVVEAETRLKTEVQRIKKKLQIQITELEMSLDVANKSNIDLQKVVKKQSLQLTEMQAHYEDVQRQLQSSLDQYSVAQRRLATLNGELEEMRSQADSALRAKRSVELQFEEASTRINELHTQNVSLVSLRSKLEQELSVMATDYEEVTKELRLSDERYQKVQVNLTSHIPNRNYDILLYYLIKIWSFLGRA